MHTLTTITTAIFGIIMTLHEVIMMSFYLGKGCFFFFNISSQATLQRTFHLYFPNDCLEAMKLEINFWCPPSWIPKVYLFQKIA